MADEKKSLEMRVAELEDKLAQVHITEDEMATYNKVAAKLGAAQPCTSPCQAAAPQTCVAQQIQSCVAQQCIAQQCLIHPCIIKQCIIYKCIHPITWNDCIGPCAPGNCATGGVGGGGFGGLGG